MDYILLRFLFDPLYEEIVNNTSDLMVYLVRHFFLELVFPLSIFIAVMVTVFVDWSWVPISTTERSSSRSLAQIKKKLLI